MMVQHDRLGERMQAKGLSQAELARRIGISQQAIGKLVNGSSRSTSHIARLARALDTTAAYLEGETDDPDEGAPPPLPDPTVQHVMMPVALPAEPALAAMFRGFLLSLEVKEPDALAHELARLLPSGLQQMRGPLRFETTADRDDNHDCAADRPGETRERRRA